jgi:hypothetical protein
MSSTESYDRNQHVLPQLIHPLLALPADQCPDRGSGSVLEDGCPVECAVPVRGAQQHGVHDLGVTTWHTALAGSRPNVQRSWRRSTSSVRRRAGALAAGLSSITADIAYQAVSSADYRK